jgi:hypothetical protein
VADGGAVATGQCADGADGTLIDLQYQHIERACGAQFFSDLLSRVGHDARTQHTTAQTDHTALGDGIDRVDRYGRSEAATARTILTVQLFHFLIAAKQAIA